MYPPPPSHRPSAAESRPPLVLASNRPSRGPSNRPPPPKQARVVAPLVLIALLALALIGPRVAYWLWPTRSLRVSVFDKTVPHPNYREHDLFMWLLRAEKIKGGADDWLSPERDYVGFDPLTKRGTRISWDALSQADVAYIADTYGVYTGDYQGASNEAALERSTVIFGGVDADEVAVLRAFVARGGTLIAEFNTFASPTKPEGRRAMEALLGVRWTGWVGRHFVDLQRRDEVPRWVGALYTKIYGVPFDIRGGGMVFVRDEDDIVVLKDETDTLPPRVSLTRTAQGKSRGLPHGAVYTYWMDIVTLEDAEALYEYDVAVTSEGAALLSEHGIPRVFPAVTQRRGGAPIYYLAGDFVDNTAPRGDYARLGLLSYRRALAWLGAMRPEENFVWGLYAPLMHALAFSRAR